MRKNKIIDKGKEKEVRKEEKTIVKENLGRIKARSSMSRRKQLHFPRKIS